MRVPRRLVSVLEEESSFLIAVHIDPDGDAIGSALALAAALESLKKKTFLYCRDPIPEFHHALPGWRKFSSRLQSGLRKDPVLILLDCNSPERAGLGDRRFRMSVVIDHHETESGFGTVRWIVPGAAATGMMIFSLLRPLGVAITRPMAVTLYTAIAVDTGTFRYSNTSAEVLRASAELIAAGAEPDVISEHLYETWEERRFRLLVEVLNTLTITDRVAMTAVTLEMFERTGAKAEDTENFSNFPRMIGSVDISTLFRETARGMWKVSLRSKGTANVARVAEQFGGGGHRNAAGCRIRGDLATVQGAVLQKIGELRTRKKRSGSA